MHNQAPGDFSKILRKAVERIFFTARQVNFEIKQKMEAGEPASKSESLRKFENSAKEAAKAFVKYAAVGGAPALVLKIISEEPEFKETVGQASTAADIEPLLSALIKLGGNEPGWLAVATRMVKNGEKLKNRHKLAGLINAVSKAEAEFLEKYEENPRSEKTKAAMSLYRAAMTDLLGQGGGMECAEPYIRALTSMAIDSLKGKNGSLGVTYTYKEIPSPNEIKTGAIVMENAEGESSVEGSDQKVRKIKVEFPSANELKDPHDSSLGQVRRSGYEWISVPIGGGAVRYFSIHDRSLNFTDYGSVIKTRSYSGDVMHEMINLALRKNWSAIRIQGGPANMRRVLMREALRNGLKVIAASEADKKMLADILAESGDSEKILGLNAADGANHPNFEAHPSAELSA